MAAIKGIARVLVPAGAAKPSPALGQALGPLGVSMGEFTKDFNARTAHLKPSAIMRVRITAFEDRTFKYVVLAPTTSWYLKRVSGISKGSSTPGATHTPVATLSVKAVYEIARSKQAFDPMLKFQSLESIAKCIAGSAKSMGIKLTR